MAHALTITGNPSSVHAHGRAARAVVEQARDQVARLVRAKPDQVIFTSGATEANAAKRKSPLASPGCSSAPSSIVRC